MPRKQRFKPSRKPKAVGTLTDLASVNPTHPTVEPAKAREASPGGVEPEAIGRADTVPSASGVGRDPG
jgi:hypothetical protein